MDPYTEMTARLRGHPRRWLVTGAAGFIGSNLVEALLALNQTVVGLDNFATGLRQNIEDVRETAGPASARFHFIEADVREPDACRAACANVDFVLHQAALGSVPHSIHDPLATHQANVDGFVNVLVAARDAGVRRFVYASSSSTYGDHSELPQVEERVGRPLSPYCVTKFVNELYAGVFERTYGLESIGLRYFNVFGRRQNPLGEYAAVIPRWIGNLLADRQCQINGDGETSRDFCYVENVVQANILAATVEGHGVTDRVYNVACGARTTLNQLFRMLREGLEQYRPAVALAEPCYGPFVRGDVRHSQADITRIRTWLGYNPSHSVEDGLREALPWYVERLATDPGGALRTAHIENGAPQAAN